jgi:hypothetical protein
MTALLVFVLVAFHALCASAQSVATGPDWPHVSARVRRALRDELVVQRLKNCTLRRYGSANDGGYLMCANLTGGAASAYSYGIDQEDNWGCDVSRQLGGVVHQYDCFTDKRPTCSGGRFVFHDECLGPRKQMIEGHPFDTLPAQVAANGDAGKPILMKIDIEGAEWESLLATPDSVLDTIVQLPMELHLRGADQAKFLQVVRRLKQHFFLVNLHFNNWACTTATAPLPSPAFQVLWVNKRVGVLDGDARPPVGINPLNAPDNPDAADCQGAATR